MYINLSSILKVSYGSALVSFIHLTRPQIIEQRFTVRQYWFVGLDDSQIVIANPKSINQVTEQPSQIDVKMSDVLEIKTFF